MINDAKNFSTNAGPSKRYTIHCRTEEPHAPPMGSRTLVMVPDDAPGFRVDHIENKLGWHGSSTGQLHLQDCRVPAAGILASFDMTEEALAQGVFWGSILMAATMLGSAEGVYEKRLSYVEERKRGAKSLYDSCQAVRHRLAGLRMELELLRSLVHGALQDPDQGNYDVSIPATGAKVMGQKTFEHAASECVGLCGGNGTIVETDIECRFRDAKMNCVARMSVAHLTDMPADQLRGPRRAGCGDQEDRIAGPRAHGERERGRGHGACASRLGELLGMPHLTDVTAFEMPEGGAVRVKKPIRGGAAEYEVPLPAVLGVDRKINTVRRPSVTGIFGAASRPLATLAPDLLDLDESRVGLGNSPKASWGVPEREAWQDLAAAGGRRGACPCRHGEGQEGGCGASGFSRWPGMAPSSRTTPPRPSPSRRAARTRS